MLDAGTGIRELGLKLDEEGVNKLDLLFSHFHMDHTQGFPFFTPAYHEGTQINIYAAPWAEHSLAEPFHRLMDQPSFPVPFKYMSADIRFHEMNGSSQLGDVLVRSQLLNHPGGCIAFHLQYEGKTLIYLTDHEPYGSAQDQEIRDFTRGADVLIREAQYTNAEYQLKRGWGHSRFDDAVSDRRDRVWSEEACHYTSRPSARRSVSGARVDRAAIPLWVLEARYLSRPGR